jgi:hypothetical protein
MVFQIYAIVLDELGSLSQEEQMLDDSARAVMSTARLSGASRCSLEQFLWATWLNI